MKALNLKNISWSLIISAMMCMVAFASCSDDEKEDVNITFPELKEETHVVGDEIEISFNAPVDWQLTSKAAWCKFVNGDFEDATTSGKAGDQTVTAKILGDGQDYINDNTTEIVLKMGDKEQVIYKITRSKKAFSGLTIKSVPEAEGEEAVEYSAENPIVVKGCDIDTNRDEYLVIETNIEDANLTVGVKEGDNPDWIKIEKDNNKYKLAFNKDKKDLDPKYSFGTDKGGKIIFSVMTSDNSIIGTAEIPVAYEGLKEGVLVSSPAYPNLRISQDGKKIISTDANNKSTVYQDKIETEIITRDDEFEIVTFEQVGSFMVFPGMEPVYQADGFIFGEDAVTDWVDVKTNGTKCTITFEPYVFSYNYDNRGVVVMAFPKKEYEKIKNDLEKNIIVDDYINPRYQSYVLGAPVQTEDVVMSFTTCIAMDGELFPIANMIGEDCTTKYDGEEIEGAGTDNIYTSNIFSMLFSTSEDGKVYYEIKNGEDRMILENDEFDGFSAELTNKAGKDYIVLSTANAESLPLQQGKQIKVKSSNGEVLALLIINIGENPF
ncbi:DUF5003 domain-containing protein [Bacteroides acidifaciens]|uniref:DUF5003 domain-containing protein n=1 Tax=Bacteroides acidifaciens TaxID=85831 RepID=UPI0025581413|nr:hypothetical protein [Bacteroides acidifaciens]